MSDDTCSNCERPLAGDDDLERFKGRAGDHLCFREYGGDCDPIDWASRFDNLRAASRALAGIDAATLDAVTPAAMRAVMERRGVIRGALVPVLPDAGDARLRTVEWAESVATRHGDVSPAEVLAEAIAAGVAS